MRIKWKQLGSPTTSGHVKVAGLGLVHVNDQDIEIAAQLGPDCWLNIVDCSPTDYTTRHYQITQFEPLDPLA